VNSSQTLTFPVALDLEQPDSLESLSKMFKRNESLQESKQMSLLLDTLASL